MSNIKSRKQKEKIYNENYSDIPKDYMDRLIWMYDKYHITINKAVHILNKRKEMLEQLKYDREFFIILYEEPEGSPRPRARFVTNKNNLIANAKSYPGHIQVYSLTGASDRSFMKRLLEDNDFDELESLIYTPCIVEYDAYLKTPSSFNSIDTYLAELGLIRPFLSKPDFDNIAKKYSDMYNGNVWLDDTQVIEGTTRKFYSVLPRVEIRLRYLNMVYSKQQYKVLSKRIPIEEVQKIKFFDTSLK